MASKRSLTYAASATVAASLGLSLMSSGPASASVDAGTTRTAPAPALTMAVPSPAAPQAEAVAAGSLCKGKSRNHIVRRYHRGGATIVLRCGSKTWGYRHLVERKRWSKSFDAKIRRTIASGDQTDEGWSRYSSGCPKREIFRVIGTHGTQSHIKGIITAYRIDRPAPC